MNMRAAAVFICNAPNAHVTLFIHTVHISLIIALIRTDKPNGWGITVVSRDKTLSIFTGYDLGKQWILRYTLKHSQIYIQTIVNHK